MARRCSTPRASPSPRRDASGKRIVDKPAAIVQAVIDEVSKTFSAKTASMFLNPALEHEAVQKALDIAKQCTWTKWEKGPVWEDLKSLTITVPPPKTAKGYGLAVGRAEVFVKTAAAAAAAHVKDFEAGKITIDELMKLLNTQIETDRTGEGAAFVPRAKVVLERSDTAEATKWVPKTYFPLVRRTRLGLRPGHAAHRQAGAAARWTAGGRARLHALAGVTRAG